MLQKNDMPEGSARISELSGSGGAQSLSSDPELRPMERGGKLILAGFDHIQLYVGNAFQTMRFLCTTFGFERIGYSGLETGLRDRVSYVVRQGNILILVTSSLDPASRIAEEVRIHGDAVGEIAFRVPDASEAFHLTVSRGARGVTEPVTIEDAAGRVTTAAIKAFGDVVYSFVERRDYAGAFLPGYQDSPAPNGSAVSGLVELDHVALSFSAGQLDAMTDFHTRVLDMEVGHEENVMTAHSGMKSKVVQNDIRTVRFPMMEPMAGTRRSQIEEYLKYNHGSGIQHLAFASHDIVAVVRALEAAGAEFLRTPGIYYEALNARVGTIDRELNDLRDYNILADRDEWGYLLQIFSKPITARPTLFFELIERAGARGFGSGNIRALFDAVERQQALRGNL